MYQIRQAVAEDIKRIAQIELRCFPEAEAATLASFQQRFAVFPECFYVLEVEGVIVGHTNGCIYHKPELPDILYTDPSLHCPEGGYQTVFGLAVDPDYQGKGYASLLTRHFIAESRNKNLQGMVLTCKDRLIGFYEKLGFACQGRSASSHGGANWNDMIIEFQVP
ncbi:putative acetyltransferase [Vibrio aerogenes CECT 7868]|uniref:Putative acetyltransferase n=1 Tax=Vibrio aerogenes CECT 7868 TaxID=1216006 RepID=A0A1M6A6D5_9VIBR|nr:GNAT family N-acetyltransferase [Vibrio aerogenes]SHI32052.1 putative acetyltransferase [Vibrio aerogenes CECT 7868]